MSAARFASFRRILDGELSVLASDIEDLLARGRSELTERLNQAARRLRQAADLDELCGILADAAGEFATGAALFRIETDTARGYCVRGVDEECAAHFEELEIPFEAAPALAGAVESRDPVTTVTSAAEVSARMMGLAGHQPNGRAVIFPVVVGEQVPALVYTWGASDLAALELLAQVAGAVWSAEFQPKPAVPEPEPEPLLQIAPAPEPAPVEPAAAAPEPASSWQSLSQEEQQVHLRAQRFARVQVAELRLYEPEAVQTGRARGDLYGSLRGQIDTGRAKFHKSFFEPCPSMVDYFHLELVRTLANDDAELLGKDYPGPMV
jgi:hypothetical protein